MNDNKSKKKKEKENEIFLSSKFLMSFVLDEYSKEFARSEKLDGKGVALMTLLIGFLTLVFPNIGFNFVVSSFYTNNVALIRLGAICIVLLVISFCLIIYTLILTLKVFKIREYKRFNYENARNIQLECRPEGIVADTLIGVYVKDINFNQEINTKKAVLIEKSYKYVIISVIIFLVTTILTIIGGACMEKELKVDEERVARAIEIINSIDSQSKSDIIDVDNSKVLKHSLSMKDSKPITESMD